jgi:hypothetical protein
MDLQKAIYIIENSGLDNWMTEHIEAKEIVIKAAKRILMAELIVQEFKNILNK